jgi:ADP-ribose pyrophosphatase YjhB (NUDIX family)
VRGRVPRGRLVGTGIGVVAAPAPAPAVDVDIDDDDDDDDDADDHDHEVGGSGVAFNLGCFELSGAEPAWLNIGRELRALAQTGLAFSRDPYDRERFERIRELAAAVIAQGSGAAAEVLLERFRQEAGYATPKVDVRAAAFAEGRVLLVREISDGAWTLPGGWADVNQTPSQCVVREVAEESGYQARALKLAAVHDYQKRNRPHHLDSIYKMFFICELTGGSARASVETSEVAFFARDSLPPLSVGRTTAAQIERMFEHAENPALPTDFD